MRVVSLSAAALALGALAAPASAQQFGIPVDYAPAATGVTIVGTFGLQVKVPDLLGVSPEKQNAAGGMVTIGLPSFQISAGASYTNIGKTSDDEEISFGGSGMFTLPLPPGTPVTLGIVAGVGIMSVDVGTETQSNIFVPAGVVLSLDVPSPALDVTPWISPQFRYFRSGSVGVNPSAGNSDFGVSGGVRIGLPMGLGFHVLGDYDNASEVFLVGAGLHFSITVPSLGVPGM